VLLTIQIDIVSKPGQNPILMPRNVEAAINFFQSEGHSTDENRSSPKIRDGQRLSAIFI
jgi:hypothetical protein